MPVVDCPPPQTHTLCKCVVCPHVPHALFKPLPKPKQGLLPPPPYKHRLCCLCSCRTTSVLATAAAFANNHAPPPHTHTRGVVSGLSAAGPSTLPGCSTDPKSTHTPQAPHAHALLHRCLALLPPPLDVPAAMCHPVCWWPALQAAAAAARPVRLLPLHPPARISPTARL